MSRIQFIDLDTSSEDKETGGVVISERTDIIEDEAVWIQNAQEGQSGDILTSVDTLKVTDVIKDDCGEINKEQENVKEKQEIEQLTTTEVARGIETTEAKP